MLHGPGAERGLAWGPHPPECPASPSLQADPGLKGRGCLPPGRFQDEPDAAAPQPGLTVAFSCSEAAASQRHRTMLLV